MTKKDLATVHDILIFERCDECPLEDICKQLTSKSCGVSICGRFIRINEGTVDYQFTKDEEYEEEERKEGQ